MTYRNDHEATLLRADALEREVARLRAEAAKNPKGDARAGVGRRTIAVTVAAGAVAAGVLGAVLLAALGIGISARDADADAMNERIDAIETTTNASALDACIESIAPVPGTDGTRLTVGEIRAVETTGAPCREDLLQIASTNLWSPSEKDALRRWAAAEDRLANAISMICVYQSSGPDKLDGGATAHQLWSEYIRAHRERDRAITDWQQAHQGGPR